jgi:AcrR family transcriptional regulator
MAGEVKRYSPSGERVLEVATEVFYQEGIRSTSMDTVVARSGGSKPTLYAQFGSKDELVAAVLRRRYQQRHEALRQFLGDQPGHPARAVISQYKRWLRATFTELARQAGRADADELGLALLMLVDGANARMVVDGDRTAIHAAKKVAAQLLEVST